MKKFKVGNVLRLSESNDFASEAGDIIKIIGVISQPIAGCEYITIRGCKGRLGLFSITSEFASSLELLTGKEIGEAIRKWDADHAKKEPKYREVKRPAKVGDTVKVLHDNGGRVYAGTVWKVKSIDSNGMLRITHDDDGLTWACDKDSYIVLSSGKHSYTAEQIEKAKKLCGKMMAEAFDDKNTFSLSLLDKNYDKSSSAVNCEISRLRGANGSKGTAKCSDHDEYNVWIGRCVALCKVLHKPIPAFIMEG